MWPCHFSHIIHCWKDNYFYPWCSIYWRSSKISIDWFSQLLLPLFYREVQQTNRNVWMPLGVFHRVLDIFYATEYCSRYLIWLQWEVRHLTHLQTHASRHSCINNPKHVEGMYLEKTQARSQGTRKGTLLSHLLKLTWASHIRGKNRPVFLSFICSLTIFCKVILVTVTWPPLSMGTEQGRI